MLVGEHLLYGGNQRVKKQLQKISYANKYREIELIKSFVHNDPKFI